MNYAFFLVLEGCGDFGNSVSYRLASSSRSGASLSESLGVKWSPPNFFINTFLNLLHALLTTLFFFVRGVAGRSLGGGEGGRGGRGDGVTPGCIAVCTAVCTVSTSGSTIGDTVGGEAEMSWSSE